MASIRDRPQLKLRPVIQILRYKISKKITYDIVHMDDGYKSITMSFNKSIPFDKLPDVDIFLTSEKNSYGVLQYEWFDGDELHLKIPKVST